jgi:SAM-dependent methyltransferase
MNECDPHPQSVEALDTDGYLRQRTAPDRRDSLYLHLIDLRDALIASLPSAPTNVLDYGCGGSPYRQLFKGAQYLRADLSGSPNVDFALASDMRVNAESNHFDVVLSTQVVEHVHSPPEYLAEAFRLLKPGGSILLTTHGVFDDHPCPNDFFRWTAMGLRMEMERAGFSIKSITKLTTGPRAIAFLTQQWHHTLVAVDRSPSSLIWRLARVPYRVGNEFVSRLCDSYYGHCRMVDEHTPGHKLYIALLAVGTKACPST